MKQQSFDVLNDIQTFITVIDLANKRIYELVKSDDSIKYINSVIKEQKASKEEILSTYFKQMENDPLLSPLIKNNTMHYIVHWVNGFYKLLNCCEDLNRLINKYQTNNDPDGFYNCLYQVSSYTEKEIKAFFAGFDFSTHQSQVIKKIKQKKISKQLKKVEKLLKRLLSKKTLMCIGGTLVAPLFVDHYGEMFLNKIDQSVTSFLEHYNDQHKNQLPLLKEQNIMIPQNSDQKKHNTISPDPSKDSVQKEQEKGSEE